MNVITKLKDVFRKCFCSHEWQQVGEVEKWKADDYTGHEVYYAHMKCVKCGKDMYEMFKVPKEIWK